MFGLDKLFAKKTVDLEAKLAPPAGGAGKGELEYSAYSNGNSNCEIEIEGLAGASADVHVNGQKRWTVSLADGRCDKTFSSKQGDSMAPIAAGDRIDIVQNGATVLSGAARKD